MKINNVCVPVSYQWEVSENNGQQSGEVGKEVHVCVCVCVCVFGVMALNRRITGLQAQSSNISHVVWELSFCITSYVLINIWMPEPKGSRFARVFVCTDLHTSVCIIEAQFNLSLAHTLASWEIYFVGHGWAPSHLSASVELFHPTGN